MSRRSTLAAPRSDIIRISDILANGTRVTGSDPTKLGEYRSYRRDASATTYTETSADPAAAPSSANGILIYGGEPWGTADPVNEPSRYRIFVGKNKFLKFQFYQNAGRAGDADPSVIDSESVIIGLLRSYDPSTGVLEVTKFTTSKATTAAYCARLPDNSGNLTNVYFDVFVTKNPFYY